EAGTGVVNVSGTGALTVAGNNATAVNGGGVGGIRIGHTATGVGILNLNGGTVTASGIARTDPAGVSFVYLNGGTLKASAANPAFLQGHTNVVVGPGGAKIDTNGNDITIGQVLAAPTGQGITSIPLSGGGTGYLG